MYTAQQLYTQGVSQSLNTKKDAVSAMPKTWKAKHFFEIQQGRYTIKTANSFDEFFQVLELRREVFLGEFSKLDRSDEQDFEAMDLDADFLIIKEHNEIIATYRIISSEYSDNFYSRSEFKLDEFLSHPDRKIELSRACVKKEKRNGAAIHLLWRGIAAYMQAMDTKYLFGCSSFQFLNLENILSLYAFLYQENAVGTEYNISPLPLFNIIDTQGIIENTKSLSTPVDLNIVPPLLYAYVKAGAKVYGSPAFDLAFLCLDFFTIFNIDHVTVSYKKKYLR